MNYTFAPAEKSTVKITMTFDNVEWDNAINAAYLKNRSKYTLNGFRKGKVPKHILEQFYGKGLFYEDALNHLFQTNYPTILENEKENINVVGDPALDVEKLSDEEVVLTAQVPVKPEIEIGQYKGLKIKKYAYKVTDEDVDADIKSLLEKYATTEDVTTRPAEMGDTANIDFSGSLDGEKFEGGTAEAFDLVLGSGAFIPGFEEQVCGMNVGEEKDINVTFPEDYQADNLKGKEVVFAIKLNALKGKVLPEATDEFIKEKTKSETLEDYKVKVREKLEKQAASRSVDATENSIMEAISETATCEIPDAMVERQIDAMMQNFEYRLMYQGLKLEDYIKYTGTTVEEFRNNYREAAEKQVKTQLVIDKIIRDEKIEATEEEIDAKIAEDAASVEKSFEDYKKGMDPRQTEYIRNDIIITKMFKLLEESNEMYLED